MWFNFSISPKQFTRQHEQIQKVPPKDPCKYAVKISSIFMSTSNFRLLPRCRYLEIFPAPHNVRSSVRLGNVILHIWQPYRDSCHVGVHREYRRLPVLFLYVFQNVIPCWACEQRKDGPDPLPDWPRPADPRGRECFRRGGPGKLSVLCKVTVTPLQSYITSYFL